jgi:hypothetical protein
VLVAAVVLYIYRPVVQDRAPMRLREPVPATTEEAEQMGGLTGLPTSGKVEVA